MQGLLRFGLIAVIKLGGRNVGASRVILDSMRCALLVLTACGRIGFGERAGLPDGGSDADVVCAAFGPWTTPALIAELADPGTDNGPSLSVDGLAIYFHSDRDGEPDLYVATRPDRASEFASVTKLVGLATTANDRDACVVGSHLWFSSDRDDALESIFVATLRSPDIVDSVVEITELGNNAFAPHVTPDELEMIYSNGSELVRATRPSIAVPWTFDRILTELESSAADGYATLSSDLLTIWFESSRDGRAVIYTATRATRDQPFSTPLRDADLDEPASDNSDPAISADGKTIIFGSDRLGNNELFASTRSCL